MTKWEEYKELWRFLRCWILHRRHRKRTGNRRFGKVVIWYEIKCDKCGLEDEDLEVPMLH